VTVSSGSPAALPVAALVAARLPGVVRVQTPDGAGGG
jgi:hypothetical protein